MFSNLTSKILPLNQNQNQRKNVYQKHHLTITKMVSFESMDPPEFKRLSNLNKFNRVSFIYGRNKFFGDEYFKNQIGYSIALMYGRNIDLEASPFSTLIESETINGYKEMETKQNSINLPNVFNDTTKFCGTLEDQIIGQLDNIKDLNPSFSYGMSMGKWNSSHFNDASISQFVDKVKNLSNIDFVDVSFNPTDNDSKTNEFTPFLNQLKLKIPSNKTISLTLPGDVERLKDIEFQSLVGSSQYYLVPYTSYGESSLGHESSLLKIKEAVDYLKSHGIPSESIHIGYGCSVRVSNNVTIESFSPLKGTYNNNEIIKLPIELSTYENILKHYTQLKSGAEVCGFKLYFDDSNPNECSDYLYNEKSKQIISMDTPRTVCAKTQYAIKNGLGGVFSWDIDNSVLLDSVVETI